MREKICSYTTLAWRRIESSGRLQEGRLPGVLPLVLYNGKRPWSVPQDLSGCVNLPEGSALWATTPRMGYLVIDVLRENPDRLGTLDNPVAWSMLLEQVTQPDQADRLAAKMDAWGRAPERRAIWEAFGVLMRELVTAGRVRGEGLKFRQMKAELTEEERNMSLAENLDRWKEQRFNEGIERGRREGEQLGLNRGRREAVQLALEIKFGELGLRFWADHLARQDIAPWAEIA